MMLTAAAKSGYGIIATCAKVTDADEIIDIVSKAGRGNDVVRVSPDAGSFNFLDYWAQKGASTRELVELLMTMAGAAHRNGRVQQDDIWAEAMREWLTHGINVLRLAKKPLTMSSLASIAKSTPQNPAVAKTEAWQSTSELAKLIMSAHARADANALTASEKSDLEYSTRYWLHQFPGLADRTRSSIEMTINATLMPFALGWLRDRFCNDSEITPEILEAGKIIILDYPIKKHYGDGQLAQLAWKVLFQKWSETRKVHQGVRPIMLYCDEAQFFVTRDDILFLTTARSSQVATVFLTQNRPNLIAELGDEKEALGLLGNLSTKIFHANDDADTNEWAARTIGQAIVKRATYGASGGQHIGFSSSHSEQRDYLVEPRAFQTLIMGGAANQMMCGCVVFRSGRAFSTGNNFIKTTLPQI